MIAEFDFKGTQFTTDTHVGWIQLGERTYFPLKRPAALKVAWMWGNPTTTTRWNSMT